MTQSKNILLVKIEILISECRVSAKRPYLHFPRFAEGAVLCGLSPIELNVFTLFGLIQI